MPTVLQVFIIGSAVFLLGLFISLIFRNIKIFVNVTLPLLILALIIRLLTRRFPAFAALPWGDITITIGAIALAGAAVRELTTSISTIRKALITIGTIGLLAWLTADYRSALTTSMSIARTHILAGIAIIAIVRYALTKQNFFGGLLRTLLTLALALIVTRIVIHTGLIQKRLDKRIDIDPPPPPPPTTGDNNTGHQHPPILGLPCPLPRGDYVPDGQYVYAFANRDDSPSICDVQIRVCHNGQLDGTYTQKTCADQTDPNVQILPHVPQTTPSNPLIQPSNPPYTNALFNDDGQRITQAPTPITIPDIDYNEPTYTGDLYTTKKSCLTPRGQRVHHAQAVIAYTIPYTNDEKGCLSELRYCHDGNLIGSYPFPSCQTDTGPSHLHMTDGHYYYHVEETIPEPQD